LEGLLVRAATAHPTRSPPTTTIPRPACLAFFYLFFFFSFFTTPTQLLPRAVAPSEGKLFL
jgi:hypothetical protein